MARNLNFDTRAAQVMAFMKDWEGKHKYGPALTDIAQACDPPYESTSSLKTVIDRLVDMGKLARIAGASRSLHIAEDGDAP